MDIKLIKKISIRELAEGYQDNKEGGVFSYGGNLNIRPPYQREFVYDAMQRAAVIDTVRKNFPLNVMYWSVQGDGKFEMIDGQQRTISICQYINSNFSHKFGNKISFFNNLEKDEKEQILNYELMIYQCEGKDSEKLEWFKTINIAGEELTNQELRNTVYHGPWVSDARRFFSKTKCAAYEIGSNHVKGSPIRQDYLETAIKWISNKKIEAYMGKHQHDPNANELWLYFQKVIAWVKATFTRYRDEMKHVEWGFLYNDFKNAKLDSFHLEREVYELMKDDEVTNRKGIYEYLLRRNKKYLNLRSFTDNQKREVYEKQDGICVKCKNNFEIYEMEADHITPWHEGGKTSIENCQMLCKDDNRSKAGK